MKPKKLLSILLATLMLLTVIPLGAISVSAAISGGFSYTVSNGEATITDYSTSSSYGGVITIPSTLGDYPVTTIGDSAFYNCTNLTSVTIPSSVKTIENNAFLDCSIPRVYYSGTETQANAISVGSDNELLFYATWYYDACVDTIYHTYTAAPAPRLRSVRSAVQPAAANWGTPIKRS